MAILTGNIPKNPQFSELSSSELMEICLSVSDSCLISLVVSETLKPSRRSLMVLTPDDDIAFF